ncbi:hypothetical protein [Streptomyces cinereospinus]|uniref:Uncharacterized protein n=1 Tax=Streptomyces cinereospinus TaxID=285561 RepID=A0ABV5NA74_9ACTN
MLSWAEGALYGAGGGFVVEAVVTFGRLPAWQQTRHAARVSGEALPRLGTYVDPPADALAALFRIVLGGAAGRLLHSERAGVSAAVAVGASTPAVLARTGSATTVTEALRAGAAPGASPAPAAPTAPAVPAAPGMPAPPAAPTAPEPPAVPARPASPGRGQARGEAAP